MDAPLCFKRLFQGVSSSTVGLSVGESTLCRLFDGVSPKFDCHLKTMSFCLERWEHLIFCPGFAKPIRLGMNLWGIRL